MNRQLMDRKCWGKTAMVAGVALSAGAGEKFEDIAHPGIRERYFSGMHGALPEKRAVSMAARGDGRQGRTGPMVF